MEIQERFARHIAQSGRGKPHMEIHPYANLFPEMEGEGFDALVKNISDHGLVEPIMLFEGKILDGRNRFRACKKAGVKPRFETYKGNDPLGYVLAKNIQRRHLTASQRVVIGLQLEKLYAKEAAERAATGRRKGGLVRQGKQLSRTDAGKLEQKGEAAEKAAKVLGIGPRILQAGKRVAKEAPDLLPKIRSGEMSVAQAEEEVRMRLARASVSRETERTEKKKRQENPREVKEYLIAVRAFKDAASKAKRVAAYGKFSPEALRFTARWHEQVLDILEEVEESGAAIDWNFAEVSARWSRMVEREVRRCPKEELPRLAYILRSIASELVGKEKGETDGAPEPPQVSR